MLCRFCLLSLLYIQSQSPGSIMASIRNCTIFVVRVLYVLLTVILKLPALALVVQYERQTAWHKQLHTHTNAILIFYCYSNDVIIVHGMILWMYVTILYDLNKHFQTQFTWWILCHSMHILQCLVHQELI